MKYSIDRKIGVPAYLQLYKQIRGDIVSEAYRFGTKLPSKRLVADELGISTVTVEHAYALLCDEGYITSKERSGYTVIFRSSDGFAAHQEPPLSPMHPTGHTLEADCDFPYSLLAKTMRRVMSDYGEALLCKSPNPGCTELREAIGHYLAASRGIHTEPSQIIISSGSEHLYSLIVELLGRKRIFAIESPSYKQIAKVYRAYDVTFEMLPLARDGIDSKALQRSNADILHITPYRSFPSGVTASASKRHEYLRWASNGDRYIVEDDFESEFSVSKKAEETLFSLASNSNVIYMNTFSKTISPSLRVGYMVLPSHLVPAFEEKLGFFSCTVPTFEQLVLAELISNGDFERHINRVRRRKRHDMQKSTKGSPTQK